MLIYIFQLITNMYPITILWIYIVRVHVVLTKYELIRRWNDQFILVYFGYLQYQMSYYRIRWYDSFNRRKLSDHDELHRSTQDEFTSSINKKENVRQFWLRTKINMSVYLGIRFDGFFSKYELDRLYLLIFFYKSFTDVLCLFFFSHLPMCLFYFCWYPT